MQVLLAPAAMRPFSAFVAPELPRTSSATGFAHRNSMVLPDAD
jgi:hypothetical protein